jgi:hypothetical protein
VIELRDRSGHSLYVNDEEQAAYWADLGYVRAEAPERAKPARKAPAKKAAPRKSK